MKEHTLQIIVKNKLQSPNLRMSVERYNNLFDMCLCSRSVLLDL